MGPGCNFAQGVVMQGHAFIRLGRGVKVNDYVILQAGEGSELVIGDRVILSFGAIVMTGTLELDEGGHKYESHLYSTVVLEDGAWIGAGAIILDGVRVGARAVVGAGAVVAHDVPPRALVVGVPARVVRRLDAELDVDEVHSEILKAVCGEETDEEDEWLYAVAANLRRNR